MTSLEAARSTGYPPDDRYFSLEFARRMGWLPLSVRQKSKRQQWVAAARLS
jgi:AraC-like DNA-binding protein